MERFFERHTYSVVFAERRDIGAEWNDVKWNKDHHQIGCHRLYYLTEGSATIQLVDQTVELLPGRVYFIPAFSVLHSEISREMNKYYIHFQADSPLFELYRFLFGRYCVEAGPMTRLLFDTVVENYTKNTRDACLKVQGAMELLMADFFAGTNLDHYELLRFDKVLRYIEENYRREIRLCELAALMNINTVYFANSFKQTFHISPKQYILHKRVAESQRLLLESEMSIKEISYAVGFENEAYFSEFFSKKIGVSPRAFRNRELPRTRSSVL